MPRDDKYGSHYLIKRLPAEVLLDAYSQVTQEPEKFDGYPAGTRALQLPDTAVKSYFLNAFGRPVRQQTRESERTSVPTITQALHIINGDTLNNKLRAPDNSIGALIKRGLSDEQIVNDLYFASFSRYPKETERAALVKALRSAEQQKTSGSGRRAPRRAERYDVGHADERSVHVQSLERVLNLMKTVLIAATVMALLGGAAQPPRPALLLTLRRSFKRTAWHATRARRRWAGS